MVVVAPIAFAFLRKPPAKPETAVQVKAPDVPEAGRAAVESSGWHSHEWTLRSAMKTPQFWMLWIAGFCQLGLAEKMAIAHQVYFFRDAGYTPLAATLKRVGRSPCAVSCTSVVRAALSMRDSLRAFIARPLMRANRGV
jgi:hypothetical protein